MMRIPRHLVEARRERLARLLKQSGYLPVGELCQRLEVSEATIRRDLVALEQANKITRTRGGALAEFNQRFPSFQQRQTESADAKRRIAVRARQLLEPNSTCYFDVGTTIYAVAEFIHEQPVSPLTVVTNSLPIGSAIADLDGVSVNLVGGELFPRQSVLMGGMARKFVAQWDFDIALLSAEGMNADGLWNSQEDIVKHQRVVMRKAKKMVFCIDAAKLGHKAPSLLMEWSSRIYLLTDASQDQLREAGINIRPEQHLLA